MVFLARSCSARMRLGSFVLHRHGNDVWQSLGNRLQSVPVPRGCGLLFIGGLGDAELLHDERQGELTVATPHKMGQVIDTPAKMK